jgi:uncharacterized protein YjbJ (UPF0337 family)
MKESVMDWDRVQGNWKQVEGKVKAKWAKLTDDGLTAINGRREELEGKIQERYGSQGSSPEGRRRLVYGAKLLIRRFEDVSRPGLVPGFLFWACPAWSVARRNVALRGRPFPIELRTLRHANRMSLCATSRPH